MDLIKTQMDTLLYDTVIPIMMATHKDVVLYRDDPIEYVRKQ